MNAQQEIVAYWQFCEAQGLQPSIRSCVTHLRNHKVKIDDKKAGEYLSEFSANHPHPKNRHIDSSTSTADRQHIHRTNHEGSPQIASTSTADPPHYARAAKVSLVSKPDSNPATSILSGLDTSQVLLPKANAFGFAAHLLFAVPEQPLAPTATKPTRSRSRRKSQDVAWVEPLAREAGKLRDLTLSQLNPRERYTFARYYAFKFRGCTADEERNRKAAVSMLNAFHDLGRARAFGGLTVAEYVADMEFLRKQTEAVFLHNPWAIKGTTDYGVAEAFSGGSA